MNLIPSAVTRRSHALTRRVVVVATLLTALAVGTAAPALAWSQQTTYGAPGLVTPFDWRGAEAGICGAPAIASCPALSAGQMFVNRFRAYSTNYSGAQTIRATSYLYWSSNGSTWNYWLSHSEGACSVAGGGAGACLHGSPAPDIAPGGSPAFVQLPWNYYYTVSVVVSWYSNANGALLAQATYRPRSTSADIGCAQFATDRGHCRPSYTWTSGNTGSVWMP